MPRSILSPLAPALVLAGLATPPLAQEAAPLVLRDVTVVDVEAGALEPGQDIVIEGGRIASVAPTGGELPPHAEVVEGSGRFVIPGLWDSHVHAFNVPGEEAVAFPLYLADGITSIRDLGAFRPTAEIRAVQAELASGERVGPGLVLHGAAVSGPPGAWPGMPVAATPEEGREWVRRYAEEGWPVVKAYSLLQPEVLTAMADEAQARGLTLFGHLPEGVTLAEALDAGQRGFEHYGEVSRACTVEGEAMVRQLSAALREAATREEALAAIREGHAGDLTFDEAACRAAAEAMAEEGAWWTPTLTVADFYMGRDPAPDAPEMRSVPPAVRAMWQGADARRAGYSDEDYARAERTDVMARRAVDLFHENGVTILAGTDAGFMNPYLFHGAGLHLELERLVEAGLTPAEALATATVNPARLFGEDGDSGTVEPGQPANLVLLGANPLEDVSATRDIVAVVENGEPLDRAALDALTEQAIAAGAAMAPPAPPQ